ncbi:unnamed protein product [Arctogadus glacialis]
MWTRQGSPQKHGGSDWAVPNHLPPVEPPLLSQLLRPYSPSQNLRSSDHGLLYPPTPHPGLGTSAMDRAFRVAAPTLWNSLPGRSSTLDPSAFSQAA